LDLAELGFTGVITKSTGRPKYHPAVMLKLYLYGYINRVQSSRRLAIEANRNIELIWLLERLAPDFKTIADFRKNNAKGISMFAVHSFSYADNFICLMKVRSPLMAVNLKPVTTKITMTPQRKWPFILNVLKSILATI
jgi:hypothetical protein